jgi:hypothetical protein
MSTVLWANRLIEGAVTSDQSDKYALYKHLSQIDKVAQAAGLRLLSELCDSTDLRFNVEDMALPDGMKSTDEWMAVEGVWIDGNAALTQLMSLHDAIEAKKPRFGLLRNDYDAVVAELRESMAFARDAAAQSAKFNFSIVA